MALRGRLRDALWDALAKASWPGMDRRLLLLSRDRLGFRSVQFPLLSLFVAHVVVILGMFLSGPLMLALWALGHPLPRDAWLLSMLLTAFSIPFLLIVPLILGRRATVLDRHRREVCELRGVALPLLPIVPVMRRRHAWASFREVVLRLERRPSGKDRSTEVYAVSLARGGGTAVLVADALRFLSGRRLAEQVASFAELPLRDETSAEHVVRRPEALDLPLADRELAADAEPRLPPSWQVVRDDAAGWEAQLPVPPFVHWRKLGQAALLATMALGMWQARPPDPGPPPRPAVAEVPSPDWRPPSLWPWRIQKAQRQLLAGAGGVCGVTALVLVLVWLRYLASWPRACRVLVAAAGLEVERRGPLGRRCRRFGRDELEELRLSSRRGSFGLTAISDRKVMHFAEGLQERDARQLRAALVWQLHARAARAG